MDGRADVDVEYLVLVTIRNQVLANEFMRWTLNQAIHPAAPATTSEGFYQAYFAWQNARRIEVWLTDNAGAAVGTS